MRTIYITHCSGKKKRAKSLMSPDELYTSKRIQAFMRRCKQAGVNWAIFSDLYGVWFPHVKREWYEKSPDSVSDEEFDSLVKNFDKQLSGYKTIYFYHHPGRFHRLYRRLLEFTNLKSNVVLIRSVSRIG